MRIASLLGLALAGSLVQANAAPEPSLGLEQRDNIALRTITPDNIEHFKAVIEARGLASDIFEAIKDAATCTACQAVLLLLKGLAALGDSIFLGVLTEVCKLSGAEDDDVCAGAIALEGPIIANDLRKMSIGSKTANLFCITFLGLCNYPDVAPYTVPFPSPKPSTPRPGVSGQTPIKVVHYSDIHIDHQYVVGSNANCTKPICCRSYTTSDAPGNNNAPAGPNGDHNCDVPVSLERSMYEAIKRVAPDAAFTLFTGDIVDHTVWATTQEGNIFTINEAYNTMASSLGLVYGTAGNHEAHPTNAFPPKSVGNQAQWVYNTLASAWTRWIGVSASAQARDIGAYSVRYPGPGKLRVISVNTSMYYIQNYYLYTKEMERDPSGQLAWLVRELSAAEAAGERVYILAHMPFGESDAFHDGSNYLDQIVNRYSSTIAAMFFGHTHDDHFEISYADYGNRRFSNALVTSYIAPSLTPTSGMPAFRVYTVDPVTFAVLDATTYIADMNNPAFQTTGPVWTKYYSAKETYGALLSPPLTDPKAELSPAFWHNVTAVFETNTAAFNGYYTRRSRGWNVEACTGECKTKEICALRAGRAQDNCYEPEPGVHFSKRAENPTVERDECGISVARAAVGSLAKRREVLEMVEQRFVEEGAEAKL